MPKSKRARTVHLTQVDKKTRQHKEKLFNIIRDAIPQYQYIYVVSIENQRNTHLKELRQELSDSRLFLGKTKLMARALGHTPEDAPADNLHKLAPHLKGTVGLLLTNRPASSLLPALAAHHAVDFARAGAVATRAVTVPPGKVYSTGGEVPAEHDVLAHHSLESELRRLGMPTRLVRGEILLDGDAGYVVCREGQTLDARQTRLLKLFSVCLSQFRARAVACWTAATGEVEVLEEAGEADGGDAGEESEDE